jgi:hypothetical protein
MPGATVTRADDGPGGIWDDGGTAMTFQVTGAGNFTRTISGVGGDGAIVWCSHASSVISVTGNVLTYSTGAPIGGLSAGTSAIYQNGGSLVVKFNELLVSGAGENVCGVAWQNGEMTVEGDKLSNTNGYSIWSEATTSGDGVINVGRIVGAIYVAPNSGTSLALWVTTNILTGQSGLSMQTNAGNKCYVTAQKIFGRIYVNDSLLYVTADKLTATVNGTPSSPSLFYSAASNGDARIAVKHWDVNGHTGESVVIDGGVNVRLIGGDLVGVAGSKGVIHNGGTARLKGMEINTAANASGNPVTVVGSGLVLDNCTLIANAARDSVTAASGQTITNYGSVANKAKNANVTVNVQAILVDANVV